jgi:GYF domain 2
VSTWWYFSDGERKGPVSDDDLQRLLISGTITSSSLVWKTGMAGWQPAAQVEGLAPMLASLPPELPPELPPDQKTPQRTEKAGSYHGQIWSIQLPLADAGVALDEGSMPPGLIL